ncbi:hypothetical protein HAX54_044795, partial [Datura stramonium]|nr:hypothetical protein [Datura stramonium]
RSERLAHKTPEEKVELKRRSPLSISIIALMAIIDCVVVSLEIFGLAEVRKGKRPMYELYELKPIVPTFSNFERGGMFENELKEEDGMVMIRIWRF